MKTTPARCASLQTFGHTRGRPLAERARGRRTIFVTSGRCAPRGPAVLYPSTQCQGTTAAPVSSTADGSRQSGGLHLPRQLVLRGGKSGSIDAARRLRA